VAERKKKTSTDLHDAAAKLGHRGGLKGGPARAKKLTAAERKAIAKKAAEARWRGAGGKKSDEK
jgi:hypothetical protein